MFRLSQVQRTARRPGRARVQRAAVHGRTGRQYKRCGRQEKVPFRTGEGDPQRQVHPTPHAAARRLRRGKGRRDEGMVWGWYDGGRSGGGGGGVRSMLALTRRLYKQNNDTKIQQQREYYIVTRNIRAEVTTKSLASISK